MATSWSHQQKVLSMVAGNGYVFDFSSTPVAGVTVLAKAECYVRTQPTSAAPSSSPAPVGGAQAGYWHLLAGESVTFGVAAEYHNGNKKPVTEISYVGVWAIGTGDLLGNAI